MGGYRLTRNARSWSPSRVVWVGVAVIAMGTVVLGSWLAVREVDAPPPGTSAVRSVPGAHDTPESEGASSITSPDGPGQSTVSVEPELAPGCRELDEVAPVDREHSRSDLEAKLAEVLREWDDPALLAERDTYADPAPGSITLTHIGARDRLEVTMVGGNTVLEDFSEQFGVDDVCVDVLVPPSIDPSAVDAVALLKRDGWRSAIVSETNHQTWDADALIEVVDSREAAAKLWADLDADALARISTAGSSERRPGVHGSIDAVDFARQHLYVLSGSETETCPVSVAGFGRDPSMTLLLDSALWGSGCNAPERPYTIIFAADKVADLPSQMALREGGRDDGRVVHVAEFPWRPDVS